MGGWVRLELGESGVKQGERGSEKRGRVRVGLIITSHLLFKILPLLSDNEKNVCL